MPKSQNNYAAELDKAIAEPKRVRDTAEWQNRYLDLWLDFICHDREGLATYLKELDDEAKAMEVNFKKETSVK